MTTCAPKLAHPSYAVARQEKDSNVLAYVNDPICTLTKTSTQKPAAIGRGTFDFYDPINLPPEMLNCVPDYCANSGTLYIIPESTGGNQDFPMDGIRAQYAIRGAYTKAALGFNFVYVDFPKAGSYEIIVTVADYSDPAFQNAYVYTTHKQVLVPGFDIVQTYFADIDLTEQIGTGWVPTDQGINYKIDVSFTNMEGTVHLTDPIGISTIQTVADRSELRKSDVVVLTCLTSITPSLSVDAADASCLPVTYDATSATFENEIVATTRSENDYLLNPFESMNESAVTAGLPTTNLFKILAYTAPNGKTYGSVILPDKNIGSCGDVIVSIGNDCNGAYLKGLNTKGLVELSREEFTVLAGVNDGDQQGRLLVNPYYIGKEMLITYDQETSVTEIIGDTSRLDSFNVRFVAPITGRTDNRREFVEFYALVTAWAQEFNVTDEVTLTLSLTYVKRNGRYYRRLIEDVA